MSLTPAPSTPTWQPCNVPVAVRRSSRRGKSFRHELLVEMAARGTRNPGSEWLKTVGGELERTLECLLGPDAPLATLLDAARFQALGAWPPSGDQPLSVWVRCVASALALAYLKGDSVAEEAAAPPARPGGVREVLSNLHACLRALPPEDQLAYALIERSGCSIEEAAVVLRVPPATIARRVARVRRRLLFGARRDHLLLRYLRVARLLQATLRPPPCAPSQLAAE